MKALVLLLLTLTISTAALYAQPDGTLDSTFGYNGITIDSQYLANNGYGVSPFNMAILSDDGIVALSSLNEGLGLVKLTKDGIQDQSFCNAGNDSLTNAALLQTYPWGILPASNGKTVFISMDSGYLAARFNENGYPDSTFNNIGWATTNIYGINDVVADATIQPDGKYLIAGYGSFNGIGMIRYNLNGTLDSGFCACGNGRAIIHAGNHIRPTKVLMTTGHKILIAGTGSLGANYTSIFFLRCDSNGVADPSYGALGFLNPILPGKAQKIIDMKVLPDGKILAIGTTSMVQSRLTLMFIRFNADGTIDSSYGSYGIVTNTVDTSYSMTIAATAIQNDMKIVIAGNEDIFSTGGTVTAYLPRIVRLALDGSIDSTFGRNGAVGNIIAQYPYQIQNIGLQSDGKIVVDGYIDLGNFHSKMFLARYTSHYDATSIAPVHKRELTLSIYPNPTTGSFTLSAPNLDGNASIAVFDIMGKTVFTSQHNFSGAANMKIDLGAYATGVYFVKVMSAAGDVQVVKLVKE